MKEVDFAKFRELMDALCSGKVRDSLGLKSEDLQLGLTLARNQLERGAKREAMRIYTALVLCEPMNPEFQLGLANCAAAMGNHHLTLQAASAVIALDPNHARGFYLSGRACLALGLKSEAQEDFREAIELGRAAKDAKIVAEAKRLLGQIGETSG